jgi:hypothetical protein
VGGGATGGAAGTGRGSRRCGDRFGRTLAVQDQHAAKVLHGLRMAGSTHFGVDLFAFVAIGCQHPDLDEFVVGEGTVDLGDDAWRDRCRADHHDRIEGMGTCAKRLPFGGAEAGLAGWREHFISHAALYATPAGAMSLHGGLR